MNPIVKKDILNVLRQAIDIVKTKEVYKLRLLSDHVIHNASIFQDKDSITIAVTVYALSKIYKNTPGVDKLILPHLINALKYVEQGDIDKYETEIQHIIKDITAKGGKTKFYVEEVLERAQIKKASRMYEHGISMGQVSDALGISLWDLMDYVGKTRIVDQFADKTDIKARLDFTRGLFR